MIACGAIAQPIAEIAERHGLPVDVHPLPPLLHNRPELIAGEVESLAAELVRRYAGVMIGYADCGTYGALDDVCERLGLRRLAGLHCYDVYGGAERITGLLEAQPGTYLLTDFLVRSFARTVLTELGLDRHPDLRDAYFGNYSRVVWLAQARDTELESLARKASAALGLPLTILETGTTGLEQQLLHLVCAAVSAGGPAASSRSQPPG
ncbi:MAG: DUF1638 domain-containing protein [Actinomycetota bacterium]|nr:DUF1638 domain-containing protein [Actinomycetota bacterium]